LVNAHKSVSINPLITGAIFRSGQIEAWGRGLERIIKLCVADNLQEPEFIITPRTFTICFHIRENRLDAVETDSAGEINGGVNDTNGGINGGINGGANDANGGINDRVNELQIKITDLMEKFSNISVQKIEKETSVSRRTIENNIKALKENGFIERIGSRKNGHWKIIKPIIRNF